MWRGFEDMIAFGWTTRMPRMVAAEVHGSLGAALIDGGDAPPDMRPNEESVAVSIGATQSTFQALDVLRRSGGTAVTIGNDQILQWQRLLGSEEGLFVEASSAAAVAAVERLRRQGRVNAQDTVVALLTAAGLKDPAPIGGAHNDPIPVPGDIAEAIALLRAARVFPDKIDKDAGR
jgi:threonine synthase